MGGMSLPHAVFRFNCDGLKRAMVPNLKRRAIGVAVVASRA